MDTRDKLKRKLKSQLPPSRQAKSQSSQSDSLTSEVLWQGQFMDGVLRVTTTSTPSILAFQIRSYDLDLWGESEIRDSSDYSEEEKVSLYLESLTEYYLQRVMEHRHDTGATLH